MVCWVQDIQLTKERLLIQGEDLQFFLELQENKSPQPETDDDKQLKVEVSIKDFISDDEFEQGIGKNDLVEFGLRPTRSRAFEIEFHTREQPAFNRQFDFLIRDLKAWRKKDLRFIFLLKIRGNSKGCIAFLKT